MHHGPPHGLSALNGSPAVQGLFRGGAERQGDAAGGGGPGLVESQTSATSALVSRDSRLVRMYKSVSRSAELIQDFLSTRGRRPRAAMVTLTYRPESTWGPRHISEYLDSVRKWLKRRGATARYVWVAELQQRGAVHYHVVFWLPKGLTLPKPDKQGWWPYGMSKVEWARRPVGYLVKYTSKGFSSALRFPAGCRISGFGGLSQAQREHRTWWVLPRYQRERCTPPERVRRAPGGGWVSAATGEWWPSWFPDGSLPNRGVVLQCSEFRFLALRFVPSPGKWATVPASVAPR